MSIVAVICVFLSLTAALGQSFWWRGPAGTSRPWYGNAAFFLELLFTHVFSDVANFKGTGALI